MSDHGNAPLRALIVGAGIAGPAVALFLQRVGIEAELFEAYPRRADVGAALAVAPNGMRVLDYLGLAEPVQAIGSPIESFAFESGDGRRLGSMAYAPPGRYLFPGVSLNRTSLYGVLLDALEARGIPVHFGKTIVAVEQDRWEVRAGFADGGAARGDFLVGADGLRSTVRRLVLPNAPEPTFTGLIGYGGFVPRSVMRGVLGPGRQTTMTFCFGPGGFFGYALGERRENGGAYWWNSLAREEPLSADARDALAGEASVQAFLALDRHWSPAVRTLVAATVEHLGPYDIYDVTGLPRWRSGRVVLVGDAAHAVSPHSGQGASMALEDAQVLAKALGNHAGDIDAAFAAYEAERRPRTDKVVALGRRNGDQKRKAPLAGAVQRLLMPLLLPLAPSQRWLYGYDAGWVGLGRSRQLEPARALSRG